MRADWNGVGHPPGVNGPLIRRKEMWAPRLKHTRRFKQLLERNLQAKESQGLSKLGGVWNSLTAFGRNDPAHTWLLIV